MEGDASPRFPPEHRIPDVPANDPIPSGELIDARYFLSGWTLARYTERFRRESGDGEASSADDLGDGATPVGSGAFGWTAEGPPGRRRARSLVNFHPLDLTDENSLVNVLYAIDSCLQYGEDADVKTSRETSSEVASLDNHSVLLSWSS